MYHTITGVFESDVYWFVVVLDLWSSRNYQVGSHVVVESLDLTSIAQCDRQTVLKTEDLVVMHKWRTCWFCCF